MKVTLKSCNGNLLTAEDGGAPQGTLIAGRAGGLITCRNDAGDGPGPWEEFDVEVVGPDQVALKSHLGFYVCAEPDQTLVANRLKIGAWETFDVVRLADGAFALKAHTGKFVCIDGGGPGAVAANRPLPNQDPDSLPGAWEMLTPNRPLFAQQPVAVPISSPTPPLRTLRFVKHNGKSVPVDDGGDVLPVFCHDGSAFTDWVHGDRDAVRDRVRRQRAAGYVGQRTFTIVGYYDRNRPGDRTEWNAWGGRECTPIPFQAFSGRQIQATPNYYDLKREYLQMLADEQMTVLDDRGDLVAFSEPQALEHMRVNGLLYASLGDTGKRVLAGLHACNEGWQNLPRDRETPEMCAAMLNAFRAGSGGWWPDMRGLSAPEVGEDPTHLVAWAANPATVITVHGSRQVNPHLIPHYFNYGRDVRPMTGQLVISLEPIGDGLGVSVGRTNDPEVLAGIAVVCLISGTIPVFMSGRGVWGEKGADGPGGIHTHAGFHEVARVATLLPKDVMRWPVVQHSGRTQNRRFVEAGETEGTPRLDFALDPGTGRFAGLLHATDWAPVKILQSCADFTITDLNTGHVERQGPINAGQMLDHRYRRARLVTGRLA